MASDNRPDSPASSVDDRAPSVPKTALRQAFGAKLRAAREARGLSITALGQETRITIAFLQILEAGDFDKLPGAVFGRGFVRSIARSTGQDGDALISEFDSLWEREAPKSVLKVEIKNKPTISRGDGFKAGLTLATSLVRRGLAVKLMLPAAAAVVMVYALVSSPAVRSAVKHRLLSSNNAASLSTAAKTLDLTPVASKPEVSAPVATTQAVAIPPPEEAPAAPVAAAPAATAMEPTSVAGEQMLELIVTDDVKIRLDVDGGETVTKELTPDTYKFSFKDRADVMVYDAAALKISFNGRPLGSLGSKGRVRRLSFAANGPEEQGK